MLEIEPPKPKKVKTSKQKAKRSATDIIARSRKKVATAEQALRSAKNQAKTVKDKFKTINKALDGSEQQLVTQDTLDSASKSVKEYLDQQKVIFIRKKVILISKSK